MINERRGRYDDIVLDLYNTILWGNNYIFNRFIERSKDDWEVDVDLFDDYIISQPVIKYK